MVVCPYSLMFLMYLNRSASEGRGYNTGGERTNSHTQRFVMSEQVVSALLLLYQKHLMYKRKKIMIA